VELRELATEEFAKSFLQASDRISERALPRLIIIDRDFRTVLASQGSRHDKIGPELVDAEARRLRPAIEKVVRELVASWSDAPQRSSNRFGVVPPNYILRVIALEGDTQRFMAVMVEQVRHRDSLTRAAEGYSLSPRETEVLSLILEGASAPEIASTLSLAESTVQSYFKHLLSKTHSRNRPSMVAKVLGWDGLSAASASEYAGEFVRTPWRDSWDVGYGRAQRTASPVPSRTPATASALSTDEQTISARSIDPATYNVPIA
jgi:DNA-binding CsgD family transcriptional regulator